MPSILFIIFRLVRHQPIGGKKISGQLLLYQQNNSKLPSQQSILRGSILHPFHSQRSLHKLFNRLLYIQ